MNMSNLKGFNLMDQLKPRIIMQTHFSNQSSEEAMRRWKAYSSEQPQLILAKEQVPAETSIIFMGNLAASYQKIHNLPWFGKP
jgi:hypothetical protein